MNIPTAGEMYHSSAEEKDAVAQINVHLKDAYNSINKALAIAQQHQRDCLELWWDYNEDGEPQYLSNFETPITITVSVNSGWMSSTQNC